MTNLYLGAVIQNLKQFVSTQSRLHWVIGLMVLVYVVLVAALAQAWYADQMVQPFHFFNDWPEWKQLDKFAHAAWSFHVCGVAWRLLRWGGLKQALSLGTITGFIIVSSIEVMDGFSIGYGASLFDLLANAFGATLFFAQIRWWSHIKIFPKYSFHLTSFAVLRPSLLGDGFLQEALKDYNGQTLWYSWTPERKWWPSFLSLAIGFGAEGMIYGRDAENAAHGYTPYRKFYLSLDLNPNYFNSLKAGWRAVLFPLTIVKCPAPAIEISTHGVRFHWIYF